MKYKSTVGVSIIIGLFSLLTVSAQGTPSVTSSAYSGGVQAIVKDSPTCVLLTRNLSLGASDRFNKGEVSVLQNYLVSNGYLGKFTSPGAFGLSTKRALIAFQKANGLQQSGALGPATREMIKKLSCGSLSSFEAPKLTVSKTQVNSNENITFFLKMGALKPGYSLTNYTLKVDEKEIKVASSRLVESWTGTIASLGLPAGLYSVQVKAFLGYSCPTSSVATGTSCMALAGTETSWSSPVSIVVNDGTVSNPGPVVSVNKTVLSTNETLSVNWPLAAHYAASPVYSVRISSDNVKISPKEFSVGPNNYWSGTFSSLGLGAGSYSVQVKMTVQGPCYTPPVGGAGGICTTSESAWSSPVSIVVNDGTVSNPGPVVSVNKTVLSTNETLSVNWPLAAHYAASPVYSVRISSDNVKISPKEFSVGQNNYWSGTFSSLGLGAGSYSIQVKMTVLGDCNPPVGGACIPSIRESAWSSPVKISVRSGISSNDNEGGLSLSESFAAAVAAAQAGIAYGVEKVSHLSVASVMSVSAQKDSCVDLGDNLHRGNETAAVKSLQTFLVERGLLSDEPSGFFGDLTVEAVKAYQRSVGLKETGMVYDWTRKLIREETCY